MSITSRCEFSRYTRLPSRPVADGLSQAPAQLPLQELHDAAHLLQREPFAAKRADDGDLGDVFRGIEPAPPFAPGHHDPALIPPLQLPRRNPGQPDHLRRCEHLLHNYKEMFKTFPVKMFATL
jgi:hypothetical protein